MSLKLLNLHCDHASRLISDSMDRPLSHLERVGLRLHLLICSACRAFGRQLAFIRRALRVAAHEKASPHRLSAEARERILRALGTSP